MKKMNVTVKNLKYTYDPEWGEYIAQPSFPKEATVTISYYEDILSLNSILTLATQEITENISRPYWAEGELAKIEFIEP